MEVLTKGFLSQKRKNPPGTKAPWVKNPLGQNPPIIIISGFVLLSCLGDFVLRDFVSGGFCQVDYVLRGFCPRGVLSYTYIIL